MKDKKIRTKSGILTFEDLAERTMAQLEKEQAFLEEPMKAGHPERVEKKKQGIYAHTCGGIHLVQAAVLGATKAAGKATGISLLITESLELLEPYWEQLDLVTIVGTAMGIKGASMHSSVPEKIRRARQIISDRGLQVDIGVDGGIRRETVPQIHAAGADWIVPGSLMFKEDPPSMKQWLRTL